MIDITEKQNVALPESITIGGVTYTVKDTPELQVFIGQVAKVEKSKVYTQIEGLKRKMDELANVSVLPDANKGTQMGSDEFIEKLRGTFLTKEDLEKVLPGIVKEVVQPVLSQVEKSQQDELSAYRQNLITANAGTCIPELVKGNTKEELDASLKESIRIRGAYPSPSSVAHQDTKVVDPLVQQQFQDQATKQGVGVPTSTPAPAPAPAQPVVPIPQAPRVEQPAAQPQSGVKQMSMEQFAQNRANLENELRSIYGQ